MAREVILPEGDGDQLRLPPRAAARRRLRHAHRGRSRARTPARGRVAGEEPGARRHCPGRALRARRRSAARGALVPPRRRRGAGAQRSAGRDRARAAGRRAGRHRGACARGCGSCEAQAHFWRGEYAMGEETARDGRRLRHRGRSALVPRRSASSRARSGSRDATSRSRPGRRPRSGRPRAEGATEAQVGLPDARRWLPVARGRRRHDRGDPRSRRDHRRRPSCGSSPALAAQATTPCRRCARLRHGDHAAAIDLLQAALESASRSRRRRGPCAICA